MRFHCIVVINKQALAQIHTSLSYICHLATFLNARLNKSGQMTINITQAWVNLCQNLFIYHNNTMKPQL